MDLIDRINELAARVARQKETVVTEEATKTAFVLPFLQALGYEVFNPDEVVPEFTADYGVKKGEKVDYAIKRDGKVVFLIECKSVGAGLENKYAAQLFRYFSVSNAKFGVLTDGIRYLFYSDLESANRMDDRPFFEFNLLDFVPSQVDELKKFSKGSFDLDTIVGSANKLKYSRALLAEFRMNYKSPSEDFIKFFTTKVYQGRITQQVRDDFAKLVATAFQEFVREQIKMKFQTVIETGQGETAENVEAEESEENGIVTTEDEINGFLIIRAIGAELASPERIVMRDAKSYCAILFDDNNRKTICRFFFGERRKALVVFLPEGEKRLEISKVIDLYTHKAIIQDAIKQFL